MSARLHSWAWSAVLVAAVAAIAWQWLGPDPVHSDEHPHGEAARQLVEASLPDWASVEIVGPREVVRFERDPTGQWLLHADTPGQEAAHRHVAEPEAAQRIAAVFETLSRTLVDRDLGPVAAERLADHGLARPELILLVRGRDERPLFTLEIGGLAPDGLSRYVRLPRVGHVLVIPDYQVRGLVGLAPAKLSPSNAGTQ